ncbi:PREDICTED: cecropin-like [Drosophila arizonae]|uniref:Cecropin-like n=1 Tax=Drosophila arizonae TaxID=7263 RepID=A0ABM1Q320_DROAR|nr:PREDICTED: cecropin-like [Drosophila arizonae]
MKFYKIFIIVALILAISMRQSEAGLAGTTVTAITNIGQAIKNIYVAGWEKVKEVTNKVVSAIKARNGQPDTLRAY